MDKIFKICLIACCLLFITSTSFAQVDGVWPGLNVGTLSCSGSPYAYSGNTTGAVVDCGASSAGDHIYQFTIATTADVTMDVCGATWDTQIHLFALVNGNCTAGSIATNDDFCGLQSSITQIGLAAGTYVVVVEGYSTNEGAYTLNIAISNCPIINDDPCNARPIVVGCSGSKKNGDNTGMTNSGVAAPSCGVYAGGDVWYLAVVPASGMIKIETYTGTLTDAAMAVYSTSGGCGGTLTEIACDDNSGFGNMSKIILTGQTFGDTIYIRVWDNNNNQTGTFEIDAADLNSDYCLSGNAVDLGSGCAQLTSTTNNQNGSIWDADDKLDFTTDWTYDFIVNLGASDAGADGLTFVIQNDPAGLSASGSSGGSMGSGGISNSLIVEIDTYINTEDRNDGIATVQCFGGPEPDHLDIWLNGDVNPGSNTGCPGPAGTRYIPNGVALLNGASNYNIENGLDHTLRIIYTAATQTLTATVLNLATTITYGTVSYSPINPMTLFGTNAPYFGFTASTGGLNNLQTACLAPSLVLPITLANFDVNCKKGSVELNWTTISEINNDFFSIERSNDGLNFEVIGVVNGAGNNTTTLNYSWDDNLPLSIVSYYRLKQTDFNGEYSYSKIVVANCKSDNEINIYPNPFTSNITLNLKEPSKTEYTIEIKNYLGQTVLNRIVPKESIEIKLELGTEISKGIYFLELFNGSKKVITKKVIKL